MVKLPGDVAPQGVDFEEDETRLPEPERESVAAPAPAPEPQPEPVAAAKPEPAATPKPETKNDLLGELARLSGHEPIRPIPQTPLMREMEPFTQRIMYDRQAEVAADEARIKAESAARETRAKTGARVTAPEAGESDSIMGRAADRIGGYVSDFFTGGDSEQVKAPVQDNAAEKELERLRKMENRYPGRNIPVVGGLGRVLLDDEGQKQWGAEEVKATDYKKQHLDRMVQDWQSRVDDYMAKNPGQPVPNHLREGLRRAIEFRTKQTPVVEEERKIAEEIAAGKRPGPQLQYWENVKNSVMQGAAGTFVAGVRGAAEGAVLGMRAAGMDVDLNDSTVVSIANAADAWGKEMFPTDPKRAGEFGALVGQAMGSAMAFYVPAGGVAGVLSKVSKMSKSQRLLWATAVTGVFGGAAAGDEAIQDAYNSIRAGRNLTYRDLAYAYTIMSIGGVSEVAPIFTWLKTKSGPPWLASIFEQMIEEGTQESAQSFLGNLVAKIFHDPERDLAQGIPESFVGGAFAGGAMQAARMGSSQARAQEAAARSRPGVTMEPTTPVVRTPEQEEPTGQTPAPAVERSGADAEAELPQPTTTPTEPEELATRPKPQPAQSADEVAENKQDVQGTPLTPPGGTAVPREILTPDGSMRVPAEFKVVDLRDMREAQGEFQPRDVDRKEREIVARQIAANYDIELGTTPSRVSDRGPPIGYGDVVMSGNTRLQAYKLIYNDPAFKATADKLRQHFGVTDPQAQPIPLASITSEMSRDDLVRFADLSNRSAIQQMNATERAQRDARAAGSDVMQLYQGGSFEAPQNREFLRAFVESATTQSERGSMARNGRLTQEGEQRLRNALLAASYTDPDAIGRMVESRDDNVRAISGAMLDVAGLVQQLKASIARGETDPQFDITPQITEAAQRISQMRADGVRPADALAQQDAFERMDPVVEALIRGFYNESLTRPVSRKKMTELLTLYLEEAQKHSGNEGLIPDETTAEDVLSYARGAAAEAGADLLSTVDADGEGAPVGSDAGDGRGDGRPQPASGGQEAATQDGAVNLNTDELAAKFIPRQAEAPVDQDQVDFFNDLFGPQDAAPQADTLPTDAMRAALSDVLANTTLPRKRWGQAVDERVEGNVTEEQLDVLIAEALDQGLIKEGARGRIARTGLAKTQALRPKGRPGLEVQAEADAAGQTSLVPATTTQEQIAAEAARRRGPAAAQQDAGGLFSDAVNQTDLADFVGAAEAVSETIDLTEAEALFRYVAEQIVPETNAISLNGLVAIAGEENRLAVAQAVDALTEQGLVRTVGQAPEFYVQLTDAGRAAVETIVSDVTDVSDPADAPNFGLPEIPETLADDDPLLQSRDQDNSPERQAMRQRLVDQRFEGKTPADGQPIAFVMGGGTAAGKGTVLKQLKNSWFVGENFVLLDPDSFKMGDKDYGFDGIPEFQQIVEAGDGRASNVVHMESVGVYNQARDRALDGGYNVVLDRTLGDPAGGLAELQGLRDKGYHVVLVGVTVRAETAVTRSVDRAIKTNRWVPVDGALTRHKGFSAGWASYVDVSDQAVLFDTEVPYGELPVVVATKEAGGGLEILNEDAYVNFRKKAELNEKATTIRELRESQEGVAAPLLEGGVAQGPEAARRAIEVQRAAYTGEFPRERLEPPARELPGLVASDLTDNDFARERAESAIQAYEESTGELADNGLLEDVLAIEVARGSVEAVEATVAEIASAEGFRKADALRLATIVGYPPKSKTTIRQALDSIVERTREMIANREVAELITEQTDELRETQGELPGDAAPGDVRELEEIGQAEAALFGDRAGGDRAQGTDRGPVADGTAQGGPAGAESVQGEAGRVLGDTGAGQRNRIDRDRVRALVAEKEAERRARRESNYQITDEDNVGKGTEKQKVRANLDAIRVLRTLEQEDRPATQEEQGILARYTGWGAFAQAMFDDRSQANAKKWAKERAELKDLVSPEEYAAARESTLNAHFTSPDVVEGMWEAMRYLGFNGGRVLEPAAGSGNFIGMMPADLAAETDWSAVELDQLTGAMAEKLYPGADVRIAGFETQNWPDNFFDASISNVPFGNYKLRDLTNRDYKGLLIHDYFIVKGLDKVRPGGFVAYITSAGTMDKADDHARKLMAKRADLVGAIRLPGGNQGAFAANAGTAVTTDILIFQKRGPGQQPGDATWTETVEIKTPEGPTKISRYFAENPNMMLGKMRLTGSMYRRDEPVLIGPTDKMGERILKAVQNNLPADIYVRAGEAMVDPIADDVDTDAAAVKAGAYYEKDGNIYRRVAGIGQPVKTTKANLLKIKAFIPIRDVYNKLLGDQARGIKDTGDALRAELNKRYDAFVKKFGLINKTKVSVNKNGVVSRRRDNIDPLRADPDAYKFAALEAYDENTNTATKAAVFEEDVLIEYQRPAVQSEADALAISLNERGKVDIPFLAQTLEMAEEEVVASLGDLVFLNPSSREYETAAVYLSGDVVGKLEDARRAAETDPEFTRHVAALEEVQPPPLTRVDIRVLMGAPWVDASIYNQFLEQEIGGRNVQVNWLPASKKWKIETGYFTPDVRNKWGHGRADLEKILEAAMNNTSIKVTDKIRTDDGTTEVTNQEATEEVQSRIDAIRNAFSGAPELGIDGWVWADEQRAQELEATYNASFNRLVSRTYDGSHLSFPGMARVLSFPDGSKGEIRLPDYRTSVIWRIISEGNTLMAHGVGSGKTFTSIMSGMEQKRLGLIQRPAYVVPNHMLEQFTTEFLQIYPGAKLLVADEKSMEEANRKEFVARAAAERWDGVIITHDAFGRIKMSDDYVQKFMQSEIDAMASMEAQVKAEQGGGTPRVKDIERKRKAMQDRLAKLANVERKDTGMTFEEMGIDFLYVDEAHLFKNLNFNTKQGGIKGLSQRASQRAYDLFMKIQYLEQSRPGRSAVFMTGTPVSNSIAELYTMMRYLQLPTMKEYGIDEFDAWLQSFAEVTSQPEIAPNGRDIRETRSISKFVNLPELMNIYSMVADVQTPAMLNLPTPELEGGAPIIVEAELSDAEEAVMTDIVRRSEEVKGKRPEKGEDNILSVMNDGLKLATDIRLLQPDQPMNPSNKVSMAIDNIVKEYEQGGEAPALAQVVFLDMGVPKAKSKAKKVDAEETGEVDRDEAEFFQDKFDLYNDIKARLIERGIPKDEIAFIHEADNDIKKARLFKAVKEGRVRVLLGTTGKMGVGTNVQKNLVAMHHIDAPWRPADLEQRDGRIMRQGNDNESVRIYRYITTRSLDAVRWQQLERKAGFIAQLAAGARGLREAEDIDSPLPEASQIKAAATGDPRIMEHAELTKEVRVVEAQKRTAERQVIAARKQVEEMTARQTKIAETIEVFAADASKVEDLSGDNFVMQVGVTQGKAVDVKERKKAGEAIKSYLTTYAQGGRGLYGGKQRLPIGTISGFAAEIELERRVAGGEVVVQGIPVLVGEQAYFGERSFTVDEDLNPVSLVQRFEYVLNKIPGALEDRQAKLAQFEDQIPRLIEQSQFKEFPREQELRDMKARLYELELALDPEKRAKAEAAKEGGATDSDVVPAISAEATQGLQLRRDLIRRLESRPDKPVNLPAAVTNAVLREIEANNAVVPGGARAGALASIRRLSPEEIDPNRPAAKYEATYRLTNGETISVDLTRSMLVGTRSIYHRGAGAILASRLVISGNIASQIAGEVRHEAIHAVFSRLPASVRDRLLRHAEILKVLDTQLGTTLKAVGQEVIESGDTDKTLREVYTERVGEEILPEEAVAHMVELAHHGFFTADEMAPVQDIIDAFERGEYPVDTQALVERALQNAVPQATSIEDIAATDPHPGPVIGYHGTDNAFDRFDPAMSADLGMHFGTRDQANNRLFDEDSPQRIIPVVIDVRNPLTLPDLATWHPRDIYSALLQQGDVEFTPEELAILDADTIDNPDSYQDALKSAITRSGFDGIRYLNRSEGLYDPRGNERDDMQFDEFGTPHSGWSYIVWEPGKVRSALTNEVMMAISGYHYSPYDFDRFDSRFIGAGEGAQAYGWGLYFAENRDVTDVYEINLQDKAPDGKGVQYEVSIDVEPEQLLHFDLPLNQQPEGVQYLLKNVIKKFKWEVRSEKSKPTRTTPSRTVWRVWRNDRPYGYAHDTREQAERDLAFDFKFKKGTDEYAEDFIQGSNDVDWLLRGPSMEEINYSPEDNPEHGIARMGSSKFLSELMRDEGIPGIRYLDQFSREAYEEQGISIDDPSLTFNNVIFDDNLIQVTKKNGEPVTPEEREELVAKLRAFHYSPYRFNKFDASKIGSGDGKQMFGYGLYFSFAEDVAEQYRASLSHKAQTVKVDGEVITNNMAGTYASWSLENGEDLDKLPEDLRFFAARLEQNPDDALKETWGSRENLLAAADEIEKWLARGAEIEPYSGTLYTVELEAKQDELISWEDPYGAQPDVVKAAMTKFFGEDRVVEFEANGTTGQELYDLVTERAMFDPAIASMQLAYQGVKGMRYQDIAPIDRSTTTNVVAFNDDIIKILEVDGKPVDEAVRKDIIAKMRAEQRRLEPENFAKPGDPVSPAFADMAPQFLVKLRAQVAKMMPAGTDVRLVDNIEYLGQELDAKYSPTKRLVTLAMNMGVDRAFQAARHEAVHVARIAGLFTSQEWQILTERAAKVDTQLNDPQARAYYEMIYRDQGARAGLTGGDLDAYVAEYIDQERVANMAEPGAQYGRGIDGLLQRIKNFIQAMVNAARGLGFTTSADIFRQLESGEIAARARPVTETAPAQGALASYGLANTPSEETRTFGDADLNGMVELRRDADGTRVRTYNAGGAAASVIENDTGTWAVQSVNAPNAEALRDLLTAIEDDTGQYLAPNGWLTTQQYERWLQIEPENVRGHQQAGGLFYEMWAPPEQIGLSADVATEITVRTDDAGLRAKAARMASKLRSLRNQMAPSVLPAMQQRRLPGQYDVGGRGAGSDATDALDVKLSDLVKEFNRMVTAGPESVGGAANMQRQGRMDPMMKRRAAQAGGWLAGLYNRGTGVTRLEIPLDFVTLTHEGGHALETRADTRDAIADLKARHAHDLIMPPMADYQPQPFAATGFSGLEIDAETQEALLRAYQAELQIRAGGLHPSRERIAREEADLQMAIVERNLGQTPASMAFDDLFRRGVAANQAQADIAQRFSATGQPQTRTVPAYNAEQISEAWSDWFQTFMTAPEKARKDAPGLFQEFIDEVDGLAPELLLKLEEIQQGYQQLIGASPVQALRSRLGSSLKQGAWDQLRQRQRERGFFGGLGASINDWAYYLYRDYVDNKHPLKVAVKYLVDLAVANGSINLSRRERVMLKTIQDPYKRARLAEHVMTHATAVLQDGVRLRGMTQGTGPSYHDALTTAFGGSGKSQWSEDMIEKFGSYLIARRLTAEWERFDNGELPNPPDQLITREALEKARYDLEAENPQFVKAAAQLYRFQEDVLEWQLQEGFITEDQYNEYITRRDYAPLNRIMDQAGATSALKSATGRNKARMIHRFMGSTRDFINPLESIAQNVYAVQSRTELNGVIRTLDRLARAAGPGGGAIAERIPANDMRATRVDLRDALKLAAKAQGLDQQQFDDLMTEIDAMFDEDAAAQIFKAVETNDAGEQIMYLWEDGKKVPILIGETEIARDVFRMFENLGKDNSDFIMQAGVLSAQTLRAGVTKAPAYIIVNFLRDQLATWILSDNYTPFVTGGRGLVSTVANQDSAKRYNYFAGLMGGIDSSLMSTSTQKREIAALRKKGFWAVPGGTVIGRSWNGFLRTMEITEAATRVGHMDAAYQRAIADGMTPEEAGFEAAYSAHDVMDFSRRGRLMSPIARLVPFLNAAIQGLDAMRRTVFTGERNTAKHREGPQGQAETYRDMATPYLKAIDGQPLSKVERERLPLSAKAVVKMLMLGAVGLALAGYYDDDEEYEEFSDYMRATHWFFKVGGVWYRFPKPFELAFFSNLFEAAYAGFKRGDPRAATQFTESLKHTLIPPHEIQGMKLYYELRTGKNLFTNRDIVPMSLEGKSPSQQYTSYTSELAKLIGASFGWSPVMVDHALGGGFATVGRDVAGLSNTILPEIQQMTGGALPGVRMTPRAEQSFEDRLILSRLTRRSSRGALSTQQFSEQMSRAGGKFVAAATDYEDAYNAGLVEGEVGARRRREAKAVLDGLDDNRKAYAMLQVNDFFDADDRRLHPLKRAKDISNTAYGIMRQMASDGIIKESSKDSDIRETIPVSPSDQRKINEILSDVAMREKRNALIVTGVEGWAHKAIMPVDGLLEELKAVSPDVHAEYEARQRNKSGKRKILKFEDVQRLWPQAQKRILEEGRDADLSDLVGSAEFY